MVYRTEESIQRILNAGWIVSENKETAMDFDGERSALRSALSTRKLFIHTLKRLDGLIKKPFREMEKAKKGP